MKTTPLAKIARPKLSAIVERDRLFRLLDRGKKQKRVIWIAAQGGSGKTTLVASWLDSRKHPFLWYQVDEGDADIASFFYFMGMAAKSAAPRYKKPLPLLTPEYFQGIPVFTRRYFEELLRRLGSLTAPRGSEGSVVVLDNYQDAPPASGFHDMIACGLDTIPDGITVVILSRVAPPPQLARLRANSQMYSIGWDDVRFSREESHDLLEMRGHGELSPETLELLQGKTEGWAAGLILLAEARATSSSPANITADVLLDYFASEIFSKADASIQDFLLKTAFLQKIDSAMAERLTGNAMAGPLLESMSRSNYFTQKYGQAYQYHPLFREFLQRRANATLAPPDIVAAQQAAARLLEQYGGEEEAIGLYVAALDWNNAERVILDQAQGFMLQGRSNTLEGWLSKLPDERINGSPWALYWLANCRMVLDPAGARAHFEKAFLGFQRVNDVPGLFLSWACVADTFLYEWNDFKPIDHWIEEADKLVARHPEFPSPGIEARFTAGMLNALTWRQPTHPDLPAWAERTWQIVLRHPDDPLSMLLGTHLVYYHSWIREFAKTGMVVDIFRHASGSWVHNPVALQHWFAMEAIYCWLEADCAACMKAVEAGLSGAEETGIHLMDLSILAQGVFGGVSLGDLAGASGCLARMSKISSPRILDKALYNNEAASVARCRGDVKKAIEHGYLAVQFSESTGAPLPRAWCLIELALSLFDDGQHEEARQYLEKGGELARGMDTLEFMYFIHAARFAFDLAEEERGIALLKQGLALGSRCGFVNMSCWKNETMSRLCARALAHDIETSYVRRLIVKRDLTPEHPVENWPYPIRIYTLGGFELRKGDHPVTFSGKAQKKPVDLLKMLIAAGGKNVPEEQIVDALWPDSEGDAGHSTFTTTISRLRQLLDNDKAVQVSGRAVTLDPRFCYVDIWAFEALVQDAERSLRNRQENVGAHSAIALKIFDLYRGSFLSEEAASSWMISCRDRLRDKLVRYVFKAGTSLEEQDCWAEAVELYRRALETDDSSEEVCQRLMSCHLRLGQQAEPVFAYKRFRQTLLKRHGIAPSDRTEALYQKALKR